MKPLSMWEYNFILNEAKVLVGNYLKKVYQLDKFKFSFDFGKRSLIVNLGKNFYLSTKNYQVNLEPSTFVMLLRKHLKSKKLINICQIGLDRFYALEFDKGYKIILKQFAKGNIILLKDEVVVAFFYKEEGLEKGKIFQPPQSNEPEKSFYIGKKYNFLEPSFSIENNVKNFFVYENEVYVILDKNFDTSKAQAFSTLSEALEFLDVQNKNLEENKTNLEELKRLEHRLNSQIKSLEIINKKIEFFKKATDYIKNNLDLIKTKMDEAKNSGKKYLKLQIP